MSNEPLIEDGNLRVKACRHGRMLYRANDQYVGGSLDRYGEFSGGEARLFQEVIQPNQLVLDIGANIGAHTIVMSRAVGPTGRVVAFEPQRVIFQMLCANLALNGLANVHCHQTAVGREPGSITVPRLDYEADGNFGGLGLGEWERGEKVEVQTVDALDLPACHMIKVDVEGMEGEAIAGAEQTIRRFRPMLYVENDRDDKSPALIQQLMDLDYRLYWHLPRLFSPDNFFENRENVFQGIISINMLGVARSRPQSVQGLREILSPADSWRTRPPPPEPSPEA